MALRFLRCISNHLHNTFRRNQRIHVIIDCIIKEWVHEIIASERNSSEERTFRLAVYAYKSRSYNTTNLITTITGRGRKFAGVNL